MIYGPRRRRLKGEEAEEDIPSAPEPNGTNDPVSARTRFTGRN